MKRISLLTLMGASWLMLSAPSVHADSVYCTNCATPSDVGAVRSEVSSQGRSIVNAINGSTRTLKNQSRTDTDRIIAALSQHGDAITDHMTDVYNQQKIFDSQKSPTICAFQDGMARMAATESVAQQTSRARSEFSVERSKNTERTAEEQMARSNANNVYFCSDADEEKGICSAVEEKYQDLASDAGRVLNPDDGVLDETEQRAAELFYQRASNPFPANSLPDGFRQDTVAAKTFREMLEVYAAQISLGSQSLNNKISELKQPTSAPDGESTSLNKEFEDAVNALVSPVKIQNDKQTKNTASEISDMAQMTGLQTKIMWMMYKEMQRQGQVIGAMQMLMTEEILKPRLNAARQSAAKIEAGD